jgi:acetyl esterase/lipase
MFESTVTTDISYGTVYNPSFQTMETLELDLYEPENDPEPLRAVVIWVHGGTFTGGDKSDLILLGEDFASRGYVLVAPNYRLKRPSGGQTLDPAYGAGDIASCVRWLRANAVTYRIDPDRIMLGGSSSGAINVLAAGYDDLVIGLNMNHWGYSSDVQAVVECSGKLMRVDEMEAGEPPFLIVHGLLDPAIPISNAVDLADQADLVGITHEQLIFPYAGHAVLNSHYEIIIPTSIDFYYRHVIL